MSEPEDAFSNHQELGRHYLSTHLPDKAVEQFRAALTLEPDDALTHAYMALALMGS
ncbi:tetratricopeptide repeat protein, partial [bacterium]